MTLGKVKSTDIKIIGEVDTPVAVVQLTSDFVRVVFDKKGLVWEVPLTSLIQLAMSESISTREEFPKPRKKSSSKVKPKSQKKKFKQKKLPYRAKGSLYTTEEVSSSIGIWPVTLRKFMKNMSITPNSMKGRIMLFSLKHAEDIKELYGEHRVEVREKLRKHLSRVGIHKKT